MTDHSPATIGERIKDAMTLRHMTAADLSRATGITRSALSRYLRGAYEPKRDKLVQLAGALRVNPAWLMGYDVDRDSDVPTPTRPVINIPRKKSQITFNDFETISQMRSKLQEHLIILDDIECHLHRDAQAHLAQFLSKYRHLSPPNRAVIDTTINAMLDAQDGEDADSGQTKKAGTNASPGTEERYPE